MKTGIDGVLYYKIGGASAGGSWVEATDCMDLNLATDFSEDEMTTKGAGGFEQQEPTTQKFELSFKIPRDDTSPFFLALIDAFFAKSIINFKLLDYAAGPGLQGDCKIFKFPTDQQIKKGQTVDVVAKHCLCDAAGYVTRVAAE